MSHYCQVNINLGKDRVVFIEQVMVMPRVFSERSSLPQFLPDLPCLFGSRPLRHKFGVKRHRSFHIELLIKLVENTHRRINKAVRRDKIGLVKPKPDCRIDLASNNIKFIDDCFGFVHRRYLRGRNQDASSTLWQSATPTRKLSIKSRKL